MEKKCRDEGKGLEEIKNEIQQDCHFEGGTTEKSVTKSKDFSFVEMTTSTTTQQP